MLNKANLTKLAALKAEAKALDLKIKALQARIVDQFDSEGIDRISHGGHTFTVVRGERVTVDVEALRALVTPDVFELVTKPVINLSLWHDALNARLVPQGVRDQVTTIKPTAGYVKVS